MRRILSLLWCGRFSVLAVWVLWLVGWYFSGSPSSRPSPPAGEKGCGYSGAARAEKRLVHGGAEFSGCRAAWVGRSVPWALRDRLGGLIAGDAQAAD